MDDVELFRRLGLALAIGLMLGVERGWELRSVPEKTRIAGIRSFTLMGLLGGLWGLLGLEAGPLATAIAFLGFTALIVAAHVMRLRREPEEQGITTEVGEMVTFALGAVAAHGHLAVAAAGGVAALALLSFKRGLHAFVSSIDYVELVAAVRLLLISVVMLPLLPNQGYGPGQALNPYTLWWMVVMVAGISFVGYVAIKLMGAGVGALLTGFFGGFASSTALTLSFSRMGKAEPGLQPILAAGVCVASGSMFLRILLIVVVLAMPLARTLLLPMLVMALVSYAGAAGLWLRDKGAASARGRGVGTLSNPFELGTALKFGLFLTVVMLASKMLQQQFGAHGVYVVASLAGLADVAAISVSLSNLSLHDLVLPVAAAGVCIAAFVNTLVKAGIVSAVCGGGMAVRVWGVFLASCAAGGAVLIWL
ncbi:MgtC family protein [mine drainage metagenome]|uniref:MgtC family protein n=1 Tax=mine drainage metagenome TaxID=410659 RepID=A0A1J5R7Q0_9ZZZZ